VVESSLDVPTGCAGKLRWKTTGMFSEAVMAEPWVAVGKAVSAGNHKVQEGIFCGGDSHTSGETSVGTLHARGNH
jgi:hypothetical protein